jgi:hypothetical protein
MGKAVVMRHTLDEASMLEILAAAESDTRPRAGPHFPEVSVGRACQTRPPSQPQASGEQGPVADAGGDEPGHGEQQIPLDVLLRPTASTGAPRGQ